MENPFSHQYYVVEKLRFKYNPLVLACASDGRFELYIAISSKRLSAHFVECIEINVNLNTSLNTDIHPQNKQLLSIFNSYLLFIYLFFYLYFNIFLYNIFLY